MYLCICVVALHEVIAMKGISASFAFVGGMTEVERADIRQAKAHAKGMHQSPQGGAGISRAGDKRQGPGSQGLRVRDRTDAARNTCRRRGGAKGSPPRARKSGNESVKIRSPMVLVQPGGAGSTDQIGSHVIYLHINIFDVAFLTNCI